MTYKDGVNMEILAEYITNMYMNFEAKEKGIPNILNNINDNTDFDTLFTNMEEITDKTERYRQFISQGAFLIHLQQAVLNSIKPPITASAYKRK